MSQSVAESQSRTNCLSNDAWLRLGAGSARWMGFFGQTLEDKAINPARDVQRAADPLFAWRGIGMRVAKADGVFC